jgi:ATP-dependent DNA helicase 2 subunit 2
MLHRINQVIKHRAVFPEANAPSPAEILIRFSKPLSDLVEQSQPKLDRLVNAVDVKRVPCVFPRFLNVAGLLTTGR